MFRMPLRTLLPFVLIFALGNTLLLARDASDSLTQDHRVISREQAIETAIKYSGFGNGKLADLVTAPIAELTSIQNDETVYFKDRLQSRPIWRVVFDSVKSVYPSWDSAAVKNLRPRNFEILLDANTGQLLEIRTIPPDTIFVPESPRSRSIEAAQYLSLSKAPPPVSFFKALAFIKSLHPFDANELVALCAFTKIPGERDTLLVWSIVARGAGPINISRNDPPSSKWRTVTYIDANTCRPLKIDQSQMDSLRTIKDSLPR